MDSELGETSDLDLLRQFILKRPFELRLLSVKTELHFKGENGVKKGLEERA